MPKTPPVGKEVYSLVKVMLTKPWCLFASELEINPDGPPNAKVGFLLQPGDDEAAVTKHLAAILKQIPGLPEVAEVTIAGGKYQRLHLGNNVLTWGVQDGLFFLALGDGVIEGIHERMKTPAPAWLTEMKEQLPVPRRATVTYVNLALLREAILPLILAESSDEAEQVKTIVSALALDKLKSAKSITGLDENGMIDRTVLEFDGPLPDVWDTLVGESLTAEDLGKVPADANLLMALKIDPQKLYKTIVKVADRFEPGMSEQIERMGGAAVAMAGFENVDAALGSLGKTWTIYNSPSEGGPLFHRADNLRRSRRVVQSRADDARSNAANGWRPERINPTRENHQRRRHPNHLPAVCRGTAPHCPRMDHP